MSILNSIRASYGALKVLYRLSRVINLFCRKFSNEDNCRLRQAAALPSGYINGQCRPPLAELPYGAWKMGRNGCEVIAVYNALLDLERPEPFRVLARELERNGLLFNGFGGTNPAALENFFQSRKIGYQLLRRRDRAGFDAAFSAADCAVLTYWTGTTLRRPDKSWNTLHTVSVHHSCGAIAVCNVSAQGTEAVKAKSLEEFLKSENGEPVCLLALQKHG